ncbi:efflux RND transporter periplasmic adaptor subunit [Massilia sp. TS11]|uniref:efflux RND transporter periplasmic adaptor subunit n=1 Tax=Massilia sp. TS11 TaxID=2908003 RepID=UPI001EDB1D2B|nr:efflux RND transporter periplasmic adaptor subunit [Massilia sp. TS11]MCG2583806.1 efflux RND transporter periplasmic adaptor subunit [Massilia sp. TS11]
MLRSSLFMLLAALAAPLLAAPLPYVQVAPADAAAMGSFEAQVEAVRQTQLASQVAGAVVKRLVNAGDRVAAGQVLFQIDARTANESVTASAAQVAAAKANLATAAAELERKRQLFARNFVARSVLEQAEAAHDAARAQLAAVSAQANVSRTESGYYVVRAPYAGLVAAVHIEQGDMAQPGRPLATVYDPAALRVTGAVPASAIGAASTANVHILLQGQEINPAAVQLLPTVDPQSMTRQLRADLPKSVQGAVPGMFARLRLPLARGQGVASLRVPAVAVVRRGELDAVYVLDAKDRPLLRQVRLGAPSGHEVDVLSGLDAGERVLTDPQAALRAAK